MPRSGCRPPGVSAVLGGVSVLSAAASAVGKARPTMDHDCGCGHAAPAAHDSAPLEFDADGELILPDPVIRPEVLTRACPIGTLDGSWLLELERRTVFGPEVRGAMRIEVGASSLRVSGDMYSRRVFPPVLGGIEVEPLQPIPFPLPEPRAAAVRGGDADADPGEQAPGEDERAGAVGARGVQPALVPGVPGIAVHLVLPLQRLDVRRRHAHRADRAASVEPHDAGVRVDRHRHAHPALPASARRDHGIHPSGLVAAYDGHALDRRDDHQRDGEQDVADVSRLPHRGRCHGQPRVPGIRHHRLGGRRHRAFGLCRGRVGRHRRHGRDHRAQRRRPHQRRARDPHDGASSDGRGRVLAAVAVRGVCAGRAVRDHVRRRHRAQGRSRGLRRRAARQRLLHRRGGSRTPARRGARGVPPHPGARGRARVQPLAPQARRAQPGHRHRDHEPDRRRHGVRDHGQSLSGQCLVRVLEP